MTYEIPLPFSGNDADKALKELLLDTGLTTAMSPGYLQLMRYLVQVFQTELSSMDLSGAGSLVPWSQVSFGSMPVGNGDIGAQQSMK